MSAHLKALVIILVLSACTLHFCRDFFISRTMTAEDYWRRSGAWFALTLAAFLSFNFWVYCALAFLIAIFLHKRDKNPLAAYALLLLCSPANNSMLPGFAGINNLLNVNIITVLNLGLLLPLVLSGQRLRGQTPRNIWLKIADLCFFSYATLRIALIQDAASTTGIAREITQMAIEVWLPYYAFSRFAPNRKSLIEVLAAFALGCLLIAPVAVFEYAKGWLLYASTGIYLGADQSFGTYLLRGGSTLRAMGPAIHALILGLAMMIALSFALFLPSTNRLQRSVVITLLTLGLIAPVSRGPWVAAVTALVLSISTGQGGVRRIGAFAGWGFVMLPFLIITPLGATLVDYLPFVGSVDSSNVEYRQDLFEASLVVIAQNPFFGNLNYYYHDAFSHLVIYGDFIDFVNTYILIALSSGLIGLAFYTGPFLAALIGAAATWQLNRARDPELDWLGRTLFATLAGVMVAIATLSPIGTVPVLCQMVVGLCLSYTQLANQRSAAQPGWSATGWRTV